MFFYKISPIIQKTAQKSVLFLKKINNLKQKKVHRITIIYVLFIY